MRSANVDADSPRPFTTQPATPVSTKHQKTIQKTSQDRESTAIHKADDLRASHRRRGLSCRAGSAGGFEDDCRAPRRPWGHVRLWLELSNINQPESLQQTRKTTQEMRGRPEYLLTIRENQPRQQRPHEGHDLTYYNKRQLEM